MAFYNRAFVGIAEFAGKSGLVCAVGVSAKILKFKSVGQFKSKDIGLPHSMISKLLPHFTTCQFKSKDIDT